MIFSSIIFIFYFLPVVLAGYYLLKFSSLAQNIWLLLASLFFYAWGDAVFAPILLIVVVINYCFGIVLNKVKNDKVKSRNVLILACILNIGILFVYKYFGFLARASAYVFGFEGFVFSDLALPLGISFITFQIISYLVDIYKGRVKAERNFIHMALYIMFFPKLISGPITRYTDMNRQIRERRTTAEGFSYGVCRFIVGMAKKVLISGSMAVIADYAFNTSAMSGDTRTIPVVLAWMGVITYTFQIYFDFSGYSDMAIGLGRMFGFSIKENFNFPYISSSIVEFWKRWHISLSTWFREYVYFPLGGSTQVDNNDKMVRNTFVVWLLTGIWHGAGLNFILWGLWHFIFIIFEKIIEFQNRKIPAVVKHSYVIIVVMFSWVMFRTEDIYQLTLYFSNMLGINGNVFMDKTVMMFVKEYWVFILMAFVFCMPIAPAVSEKIRNCGNRVFRNICIVCYPIALMVLFVITICYIVKGSYNPFIYANF